jgi:pimeloyl-[acyl-carrier protein] methyl ester esterase
MSDRPLLLLIHGWAMSPVVWGAFADSLATHFEVKALCLPGHGGAAAQPGWTAAGLAQQWLDEYPDACWLGWSLGAQVVLAAASRPSARMKGAVLLAGTPRFVASDDWPCAMLPRRFNSFRAACEAAPEETLRQFLSLQVVASEHGHQTLATLRERLQAAPPVPAAAMLDALRVLADTDLRDELEAIRCPLLWINGAEDRLVPCGAARNEPPMAGAPGSFQTECLAGAGHVAFISHQQQVLDLVLPWLLENIA